MSRQLHRALQWLGHVGDCVDCFLTSHQWWPHYSRIVGNRSMPIGVDPIAICVRCGAVSHTPTRHFKVKVGI